MSDDLIKRSDAIKAINKALDRETLLNRFVRKVALDAIRSTSSADKWIPCSERLPSNFSEDEAVLVTTDVDGCHVELMLAVDVERFYLKGYVSAWMPSPKPFEGAKQ